MTMNTVYPETQMTPNTYPTLRHQQDTTVAMAAANHDTAMSISAWLHEARRYWIALIGLPVVFAVAAAYVKLTEPKLYLATVTLQIDPTPDRAIRELPEVYDPGYGSSAYNETQYKLLRSRTLIEQVVDELQLDQLSEFTAPHKKWYTPITEWILIRGETENANTTAPELPPGSLRRIAVSRVQQAVYISPAPLTQLVSLSFESQDPKRAATIANALADAYIDSTLQARLDMTRRATAWLTDKLSDIASDLSASENELQKFRESQNLINIKGTKSLIEEEILDLSNRVRDAKKRSSELNNAYREIQRAGENVSALESVGSLLLDPLVQQAGNNYLKAQDEIRRLEQRYGARHPQMATAQARLQEAQRAYSNQLKIAANGIRTELEIARENTSSLERALSKARNRAQDLDRQQFKTNVLEREVTTNRQLYDLFLSRFKETETGASYNNVSARVVDPALPPTSAYKPQPTRIAILSGLAGLALALALLGLRVHMRREIETLEDLEQTARLPVLGILPRMKGRGWSPKKAKKTQGRVNDAFAESVRSVRAALLVSDVDRKWKHILVSSAAPSDGKSTFSAALADAFAMNEKVLLIDTDLRKPRQHNLHSIDRQPGLSEYLSGEISSLDECVHHYDAERSLYILTSGTKVARPGELLSSDSFRQFIKSVSKKYDRIIYDSPPASVAGDALLLHSITNATILVARSEQTKRTTLLAMSKMFAHVQGNIIGTVLNDAGKQQAGYQYYSKYYT